MPIIPPHKTIAIKNIFKIFFMFSLDLYWWGEQGLEYAPHVCFFVSHLPEKTIRLRKCYDATSPPAIAPPPQEGNLKNHRICFQVVGGSKQFDLKIACLIQYIRHPSNLLTSWRKFRLYRKKQTQVNQRVSTPHQENTS